MDQTLGERAVRALREIPRAKEDEVLSQPPLPVVYEDIAFVPPAISEVNEEFAFTLMDGKSAVIREVRNGDSSVSEIVIMNPTSFREWMAPHQIRVGNRIEPLSRIWLRSAHRRQYDGIVFAPHGVSESYYNLFRGFPIQPADGDCSLYLEFVRDVICDGNDDAFPYVMNWLAHIVQKPAEKPGTALVLRGAQGTGKNTFAGIPMKLIGHSIELADMRRLTGQFNFHLADKLIVFCNEATWGGDRQSVGSLKAFITDKEMVFEKKHVSAQSMPNYARLIIASNDDWPVHADPDDRRFVWLDVSSAHARDHDYFAALWKQMNSGGYGALMKHLRERDISGFNPANRPDTGFGNDAVELSMTPEERFWFQVIELGELPTKDANSEISQVDADTKWWLEGTPRRWVYDAYLDQSRKQGVRHTKPSNAFFGALYRLLGAKGDNDVFESRRMIEGKREWCLRLLPLQSLRRMYDDHNKTKTDWTEVDG